MLLVWLVSVLLLLVVRVGTRARAAVIGACIASLGVGVHLAWMPAAVEAFGGSLAAGIGCQIVLACSAAPAGAVYGVLVCRIPLGSAGYAPGVGALWGCVELTWANAMPGLPWIALGASQIDGPLAPLAMLVGVHGVSALVAAGSGVAAQILGTARVRTAFATAFLIGGGLAVVPSPEVGPLLRVALVQPGLAMHRRAEPGFERANVAALLAESRAALAEAPVDLIVWPESAFLSKPPERVQAFVDAAGVELVAGGRRRVGDTWRASVFHFRPGASSEVVYDKRRLLPFAERGYSAGPGPAVGIVAGRLVGLALCWEIAFQRHVDPDAGLLVNPANDGWFDRTDGAEQHLRHARWRAIEAAAPVVRVAATGISAAITSTGALEAQIETRRRSYRVVAVRITERTTPFERFGNAPLVGVTLLYTLVACTGRIIGRARATKRK